MTAAASPAAAARRWWQRALVPAATAALVLAPLLLRVSCEARGELDAADRAQQAGDVDGEIVHLGRALRWRLPLSRHDEVALARLLAIADTGDDAVALAACREIRSALLGSRALDVPHDDVLADVDARIAALAQRSGDAVRDEAEHHALLREASTQSRVRPALAALAFVGWVVATATALRLGLDRSGRAVPGRGARWLLAALALLLAWLWLW
ncbi:MAG: hypothetical protein K1X88_27705 [Nannocystaceae bacterium]|nr:hypothetical protein [Nannocystaceae bacterium]